MGEGGSNGKELFVSLSSMIEDRTHVLLLAQRKGGFGIDEQLKLGYNPPPGHPKHR